MRLARDIEEILRRKKQVPFGFSWEGRAYMVMPKRLYTVAGTLHFEGVEDEIGLMSVPVGEMESFSEGEIPVLDSAHGDSDSG